MPASLAFYNAALRREKAFKATPTSFGGLERGGGRQRGEGTWAQKKDSVHIKIIREAEEQLRNVEAGQASFPHTLPGTVTRQAAAVSQWICS